MAALHWKHREAVPLRVLNCWAGCLQALHMAAWSTTGNTQILRGPVPHAVGVTAYVQSFTSDVQGRQHPQSVSSGWSACHMKGKLTI